MDLFLVWAGTLFSVSSCYKFDVMCGVHAYIVYGFIDHFKMHFIGTYKINFSFVVKLKFVKTLRNESVWLLKKNIKKNPKSIIWLNNKSLIKRLCNHDEQRLLK